MSTNNKRESINIRPGVSILSVLRHLNYKPWYALAEFVDNSLQSFLNYRTELKRLEGQKFKLKVSIDLDTSNGGRITIRDNAAGIHKKDYARAFRTAEVPPDRSGLSEFGMGMKSAACWFSPQWEVRTSALGEKEEKTVSFDIGSIVKGLLEELKVQSRPARAEAHFTEIILKSLHKPLHGRTISKVKDHLASIYRMFIRDGILELKFGDEVLLYREPKILKAPFYKAPSKPPEVWRKDIDISLGGRLRAYGFAALRETGSTSEAGFALFRRNRLIQGSADEGYRPESIFGRSNSFTYQRLFGEIQLQGFQVSHTKDGFFWDEYEEAFLRMLEKQLDAAPLPILKQAEGHRAKPKREEVRPAAEAAVNRTAEVIEQYAPTVLEQLEDSPGQTTPHQKFSPGYTASERVIDVELNGVLWQIVLNTTDDPAVGDWVDVFDQSGSAKAKADTAVRRVGIRLALDHPFTQRFAKADNSHIEPLLRVAAAIGLAEASARDSGVKYAGTIRRNVNELLRKALSSQ